MSIKHIVLCGGIYNGIYTVGALKYLAEHDFYNINEIENIYGTSAGGFLGALICLKEDWNTIANYIIERPWSKEMPFTPDMLFKMITNKGLLDDSFIKLVFIKLLKAKNLSESVTLKEFYEYSQIKLFMFATDINTFKVVEISYETYPDMLLLRAIYITCCIPFIFQPVYINNTFLVDGGILCNYPLDYCIRDGAKKDEILGINFKTNYIDETIDEDINILHYGYYIFRRMAGQTNVQSQHIILNQVTIPCDSTNIDTAILIIKDKELRKKYIKKGEECGKQFIALK